MNGLWLGLFVFIIFGSSTDPKSEQTIQLFSIGSALAVGAGIGMLWQVIRFSMNKSKRSFTSASSVVANSYAVLVPNELTSEASQAFIKGGEQEA
jgi:multisubunit Na+/H+ antiporter MnhB subunit